MKSETLPRKLAAILYADVAGYSRLTADDEDATHLILRQYLDGISATVDRHGGRVMHYAGDAVLAMFGAVLDALKCAVEIQRDLEIRNAELPSDRRVEFRIGVNLGDVIEDRGDIYGDGVNVAARLESLAEPGAVCVSEAVRAAVGKRLPLRFDDLGEQVLKNIEQPVRAYRVRPGAPHAASGPASLDGPSGADARAAGRRPDGALGRLRSLSPFAARRHTGAAPRGTTAARTTAVAIVGVALVALAAVVGRFALDRMPPAQSIAVLPLANFSGDPEQDYFADGMTDALITSLAKISALRVVSRRSVIRYRDSDASLRQIASELGVRAVLSGSAILDKGRIRITAQLVDAIDDVHLWAEDYEREVQDVLALQSSVALDIARQVAVAITPDEERRLSATRRVDPETYAAYLRGMHYLHRSTPEDVQTGLRLLHETVDRDPADPLAYAGLALGYATVSHGANPPPDAWQRARAAALRALALDPESPEAHAALADVKLYFEWDLPGSLREFQRALELNPGFAMNHYHYAWYLALVGRLDEAIAEHIEARNLDPLTPLHSAWLGSLYLYRGDYDLALEAAQRSLDLDPDYPEGLFVLGTVHLATGMHEDARRVHERLAAVNPSWRGLVGVTYALLGDEAAARQILDEQRELHARTPSSWTAFTLTVLHAALGEADEADRALAFEPHHAFLGWLAVDPLVAPVLAGHPAFEEMRRRLGLQEDSCCYPTGLFGYPAAP